jgi:hypothetical protein
LGASEASKNNLLIFTTLIRTAQSRIFPVAVKRFDRTIIEGLQDIVVLLEAQLHPVVKAESSVIVDVLYRPEYIFQPAFFRRLIKHTERLLEDKEEKLYIQVLNTFQMMNFDVNNGEKVFQVIFKFNELHKLTYCFLKNRETH